MFVVTLNKASLKKVGIGAMCCALVAFSALLGRYISTRTVAVSASGNKIESAQDIQTWFTGYGLDVDGASITADKVKIPRKWDDSFSAFNGVVQQSGLDLDVVDHYNGTTRSVSTLSGGESFMASLSLALGLSDEIQESAGGVQLDALFVDEGFGSLDEETLDQAMKAIQTLAEDGGRIVGIISHVTELQNRIDRQLLVRKMKSGGSTVTINIL